MQAKHSSKITQKIIKLIQCFPPIFLLFYSQLGIANGADRFHYGYDTKKLSSAELWLKLIHFDDHLFRQNGSVNSAQFYLSKKGSEDAKAELDATLSAFFIDPKTQCRFPARLAWLKSIKPKTIFPKVKCPELMEYQKEFQASSVSIIHASGYLGNPASMFGHLFLKFNKSDANYLMDDTFSFGAIVPDEDNKLTYIAKGIFGGYQGRFSNQKYHHQNLSYTQTELRDLWEYRLNLSQEKVDFLLAHLWELQKAQFTYYFFDENCAYQLAKILELISDTKLTSNGKLWKMPIDVIDSLYDNQADLIKEVIYHESRQETLYRRFDQLSKHEKKLISRLIETNHLQTLSLLKTLDETSAKRIIDVMYDYFAFIKQKNSKLTQEQESIRKKLLEYRFTLSSGNTNWVEVEKKPPHRASKSSMVRLSSVYNDVYGNALSVKFRANYYDILNVNSARAPFSELTAFEANVLYSYQQQEWTLREFYLIKLLNLNTSQTGLAEDKSDAWGLSIGYKPKDLSCFDCSDVNFNAFWGKSVTVLPNTAFYLAASGEFQVPSFSDARILTGMETGLVANFTDYWATSLRLQAYIDVTNKGKYQNKIFWEQRFLDNRKLDLRASVNYDNEFEYSLGVSFFW